MAQVVQLMAALLFPTPSLCTRPGVRMFRVLGTSGIKVAVRLLSCGNDIDNAIDIGTQLLVGIGLQQVAGPLNGFVGVCIVEGESPFLDGKDLRGVFQMCSCIVEVGITSCLLTLRESKGNRYFSAGLQPLSPESAGSHFHRGKGNGINGITMCFGLL